MVVLQSMWKGPNHFWNFMESGSESATYISIYPYWIVLNYVRLWAFKHDMPVYSPKDIKTKFCQKVLLWAMTKLNIAEIPWIFKLNWLALLTVDPSWCNSTNRKNLPFMLDCCKCQTDHTLSPTPFLRRVSYLFHLINTK